MISTGWEHDSIILPKSKTLASVRKSNPNLPWEDDEDTKMLKEAGEKWEREWEMVSHPIWPGSVVAPARLSYQDAPWVDEEMNMKKKDHGWEMISRPRPDHHLDPENHSSWIPSPSIFTSRSGTISIPFPTAQLQEAYWHLLETKRINSGPYAWIENAIDLLRAEWKGSVGEAIKYFDEEYLSPDVHWCSFEMGPEKGAKLKELGERYADLQRGWYNLAVERLGGKGHGLGEDISEDISEDRFEREMEGFVREAVEQLASVYLNFWRLYDWDERKSKVGKKFGDVDIGYLKQWRW